MPFTPPPPQTTTQVADDTQQAPLMSEMIKRAATENPISVPPPQYNNNVSAAQHPSAKWPMFTDLMAGMADIATTQNNLAHGARELNPLVPTNPVGNGLVLGAGYLGRALLTKYLNDHGHPGIAKILGYGGAAEAGLSALHNLMVNHK